MQLPRRRDLVIVAIVMLLVVGGGIGWVFVRISLLQEQIKVRRAISANDLHQLAMAMISYENRHREWPPAALCSPDGTPLLSWRVAILPELGFQELYEKFHLDEPWNSEHNQKLIAEMPICFGNFSEDRRGKGRTVYLAPRGPDTVFPETGRLTANDILFGDGPAFTVLLVEADYEHAVEWTRPEDWKFDTQQPAAGLGQFEGSFIVAYCDGRIGTISKQTRPEFVRGLFTRNGGEDVSEVLPP